ncbi:YkgJ family cysteine cluster protein [Cellvibrio fontiphilus]|jgi:Fe-S-cluster containining protein|uniref:YkgJ family cysteine cluster protein n=1 Tax=Cellvibrio fontiphilus TaxID=1815559 RepID=A0ABV7FAX4_9GAMM
MNDFFQQTAQREFQSAVRDLSSAKQFQAALNKSLNRYDKLIAKTIDEAATKPACRAGCAFCCYYKVEVRAHEVLNIRAYLDQHLARELREKILQEIAQNAAQIRNMTPEQQLTTNLKCPLLQDNQCSAYPVRPYRCRNFHATDASACEASFADPANMDISTGMVETLAIAADAHSQGFEAAIEHQGLDARVYDFTTALQEALTDEACVKRYLRGKKTFQQAIEVN